MTKLSTNSSLIKESITTAGNKPSVGLQMKTGILSANERIEYSTLMLIKSIINKEMISQFTKDFKTEKEGMPNTLYERTKNRRVLELTYIKLEK